MMRIVLTVLVLLMFADHASAAAKTPFEGAWISKEQPDKCDDAGLSGDGFVIEGRTIGSGDTVCTIRHIQRRGETFFLRLLCHGLNRSMAGTHYARIDRLAPNRILFRHRGQPASEMLRCK
jgi:hypothetical protein